MTLTYAIIAAILLIAELVYFKIADHFNIIDKPNERSSHTTIVLRGGGVIFAISMLVWFRWQMFQDPSFRFQEYLPFLCGLVLICSISFWDDVHSLPDSVRMGVQILSILLMFWSVGLYTAFDSWVWMVVVAAIALFFCVGATNIINFMDGINGITAGYALAMLVPLLLVSSSKFQVSSFIEPSYLVVAIIGVLVFSIFNFWPKGKAKCFAGDVGSIGIAFIILFALGRLMLATKDVTWIVLFLVYGIDGSMTIFHRIMLHENLGQAHRKHAYQLMANELKMSHVTVSCIYMVLQLVISIGFIYLCPNTILAHWVYLIGAGVVLAIGYILFMRKYYYLHEQYLKSLEK